MRRRTNRFTLKEMPKLWPGFRRYGSYRSAPVILLYSLSLQNLHVSNGAFAKNTLGILFLFSVPFIAAFEAFLFSNSLFAMETTRGQLQTGSCI
jgi:hypothetical protein